ncbi:MAG: hypothetical protein HKM93_05375 [Desulfobacteraceae bacterium]|nr:hypothetical protein [Desulfobacteraceae bacterium]
MKKNTGIIIVLFGFILSGCSTAYKATPISFKAPSAYTNNVTLNGAQIAAQAFDDGTLAKEAFGFDIRGAGMLPVQVIFDNQGEYHLEVNAQEALLEDTEGNLWPILNQTLAHERATKYAQTKETFAAGAYKGFLGATAGAVIGAAIGIVTGEDMLSSIGKGAAVGGAAGATLGGAQGYSENDARRSITSDLRSKSLENKAIKPGVLAHGILFFPGEAKEAGKLRIQLIEKESGTVHPLVFDL